MHEHREHDHGGHDHHGMGMGRHHAGENCCGGGEGRRWHIHADEGGSGGFGFRRRFISRAERIARLEAYLKDLRAEAEAVEERLAELKAANPSQG